MLTILSHILCLKLNLSMEKKSTQPNSSDDGPSGAQPHKSHGHQMFSMISSYNAKSASHKSSSSGRRPAPAPARGSPYAPKVYRGYSTSL